MDPHCFLIGPSTRSYQPADLVYVEVFGSDETRPLDYSLEQVRKTNLFIAVYAERYGTVDKGGGDLPEILYQRK